MKGSFVTSIVVHIAVLGFGLFTLTAPEPFEVDDETVAVATISETQLAQLIKGDRAANVAEKPAPKPTTKPQEQPEAENIGDNSVDLDNTPTPAPSREKIEAATPPAQPKTEIEPVEPVLPQEAPVPQTRPEPIPTNQATPQEQPKQDVEPEPEQEAVEEAKAEPEQSFELPDSAPVPQSRPKPPARSQTAKAPDRRDSQKPARETKPLPKNAKSEAREGEEKALVNLQKASGGGQKREQKTAALGASRTNAAKLSASELGKLRDQLGDCWWIDPGLEELENLKVSVHFKLNKSGRLEGRPTIVQSSGNRQFDRSAIVAVQKCDRKGLSLPKGKYETWREVIVNFNPSDMLY